MSPRRWSLAVAAVALALLLGADNLATDRPTDGHGGPSTTGLRLVLDEDFAGDDLDGDRWGTCFWWATDGCTIASNDELQWYRPDGVSVRGGTLRLEARPEQVDGDGDTFPYVSGMISSGRPGDEPEDEPRFAFTYGVVQVRLRAPAVPGTWPAVWMLPVTNESRPEIDLMEVYGDRLTEPSMTLHHGTDERERGYAETADLSTGWHTVELEWAPGRLRWWIDGLERFSVEGDAVPAEPMYLVANLAVGGAAGSEPRPTDLPAALEIDSVRVWQRP